MNQRSLIIFEKKSQKEPFLKSKSFRSLIGNNYSCIYTMYLSYFAFKYPSLKYRDYPITQMPRYSERGSVSLDDLIPVVSQPYSRLIIATNYDYRGFFSAHNILVHKYGESWRKNFKEILVIPTDDFSQDGISQSLLHIDKTKKERLSFFEQEIESAKVKYYFDYNYNLNSQVFFKEILLKRKILVGASPTLTKYMIFVLWEIKRNLPDILVCGKGHSDTPTLLLPSHLLNYMQKKGIGSIPSMCAIVDNLTSMGLIDFSIPSVLTSKGEAFIPLLVKQTRDPHISERLKGFMSLEADEAYAKIDAYILSVFGKQKNKNKSL